MLASLMMHLKGSLVFKQKGKNCNNEHQVYKCISKKKEFPVVLKLGIIKVVVDLL